MQKSKYGFFGLALIVYCPYGLVTAGLVWLFAGPDMCGAFGAGSLVSAVLFAVTMLFAERMLTGAVNSMLLFIFGGFIVRFVAVLGAGAIVYLKTDLNILSFFLGLFGSYIVLQILEIVYLHKRLTKQVTGAHERLEEPHD